MKRVVMFSGGAASWYAARRVADEHGIDDMTLLFTDTSMEDDDLYRFLDEAAANIGVPVTVLKDGRDVWDVFFDERFLGNTMVDPCSRVLKREPAKKWITENCDPADTVIYFGMDWTEGHRMARLRPFWEPYQVEAPLMKPPLLMREQVLSKISEAGIEMPRLYRMNFPHNNCGGFCVKTGQGHFKQLLEMMPERYAYHEQREQEFREFIGKDVGILIDRRGGETKRMTMREFRERLQANQQDTLFDLDDFGGCNCWVPESEPTGDDK
jgi:hypothetical protein